MSGDTAPAPEDTRATTATDEPLSNLMADHTEVLFRQVHPDLMHAGEPASSAFVPKPSDKGYLSVDRSSVTTAKAAYDLYVANGLRSVATYGLTVGEFGAYGLPCKPDPITGIAGQLDNPAHALVDYNAMTPSHQKRVGKRLKTVALARGILHKP